MFAGDRVGHLINVAASAVVAGLGASIVAEAFWVRNDYGDRSFGAFTVPAMIIGGSTVAWCAPFLVISIFAAARPGGLLLRPDRLVYRVGWSGFDIRWEDVRSPTIVTRWGAHAMAMRVNDPASLNLRGYLRLLEWARRGRAGWRHRCRCI